MKFKKVTINEELIPATDIDVRTFLSIGSCLELTIDKDYYTILVLDFHIAKNIQISGYEITDRKNPKLLEIYLEI